MRCASGPRWSHFWVENITENCDKLSLVANGVAGGARMRALTDRASTMSRCLPFSFFATEQSTRRPPGFHTTARELQTCTFKGPSASNTTKFPRENHQRERKRAKMGAGEKKKKREILGPHPSSPHAAVPDPSGPTLRTPTLGALTFSRSGPHPSGPPTLRAPFLRAPPFGLPSLRAEALRASTFSGFGPLRSSFLSCCSFVFFCVFLIVSIS